MGAVVCAPAHRPRRAPAVRHRRAPARRAATGSSGSSSPTATPAAADLVLVGIGAHPQRRLAAGLRAGARQRRPLRRRRPDQPPGHRRRRRLRRVAGRAVGPAPAGRALDRRARADRGSPSRPLLRRQHHAPVAARRTSGPTSTTSGIQFAGTPGPATRSRSRPATRHERSFLAPTTATASWSRVLGHEPGRQFTRWRRPLRHRCRDAAARMTIDRSQPDAGDSGAIDESRPSPTPDRHAARPRLHRRGVLRRRAGAHLRAHVVLRRPRPAT